jgi:hypothetical protein
MSHEGPADEGFARVTTLTRGSTVSIGSGSVSVELAAERLLP